MFEKKDSRLSAHNFTVLTINFIVYSYWKMNIRNWLGVFTCISCSFNSYGVNISVIYDIWNMYQ